MAADALKLRQRGEDEAAEEVGCNLEGAALQVNYSVHHAKVERLVEDAANFECQCILSLLQAGTQIRVEAWLREVQGYLLTLRNQADKHPLSRCPLVRVKLLIC